MWNPSGIPRPVWAGSASLVRPRGGAGGPSRARRPRRPRPLRSPAAAPPRGDSSAPSQPPRPPGRTAPSRPAARGDWNARGRGSHVHQKAACARFTGGVRSPADKPSLTRGVTPGPPAGWGARRFRRPRAGVGFRECPCRGRAKGQPEPPRRADGFCREWESPGAPPRTSLGGLPARGSTRRPLRRWPHGTERTWAPSATPDP